MEYIKELHDVAKHLGGYVSTDDDGFIIRVDTGDRTSNENYDDLMY